jgi:hypothetical protein
MKNSSGGELGFRRLGRGCSGAVRVRVRAQEGAAEAYKGAGVLLGVRATLGGRARGGVSGGTRGVRVGDGSVAGMTGGAHLSVSAGGG